MDRIKFYSNVDMTIAYNFNKAIDKVKSINENETNTINDILEFFNISKLFNEEYLSDKKEEICILCTDSLKIINRIIGRFCATISDENIEYYISDVELEYEEDFFEMIEKYKVFERISDLKFSEILYKKESYIHFVLRNRNLVVKYDEIVREKLLKYIDGAILLLDEYEKEHIGQYNHKIFPKSLTNEDKNTMLVNYINSDFANLNYLRMIENFQATSDLNVFAKTKLLAKRKTDEQEEKFFENGSGIEMLTQVDFKENQKEAVEYSINGENWNFSYDIKWIKENIDDYSTILNNYIYLFDYVDKQMRWNVVSKPNYMGMVEKTLVIQSKRDYPAGAVFNRINQLADIQMYGYCTVLYKNGVRIEDVLEWFFNQYLVKCFNIQNYNISLPSKESNYLEKCRAILPEIDSCLKQFNLFVDDGIIDTELLQMMSDHLFYKDVKSLLNNKYVYPDGNEFNLIAFYLFSDQCMLAYVENKKKEYKNFYQLLVNEKIRPGEIVKYEQSSLQKLIDGDYIYVNEDGYITIRNRTKLELLYDLYNNEVISYWRLNDKQRLEIDCLIQKGLARFESSLFSKPEQDYLNYYMNKSEFVNSLDLRNKYSHGTQPFGDEEIHKANYIKFLKIFVLIIIKINDELCINDDLLNGNN